MLNGHGMLDLEPPDHTRIRRLVSKAFTPRTVRAADADRASGWRPSWSDGLVADGGGDLLAGVAEPLPVAVIAEMLGIPEADRALLRPWSADICGMFELNPSRGDGARSAVRASVEFSAYLRELIAAAAQGPGRGPDLRADRRARRGGPAHRAGDDLHLCAAAERRPRGDRQHHRQRLVDAVPPPRPAGRAARRTGRAAPTRRGGADALRHPAADVRALGPGRHRDRRRRSSRAARRSPCSSAPPTATRRASTEPDRST